MQTYWNRQTSTWKSPANALLIGAIAIALSGCAHHASPSSEMSPDYLGTQPQAGASGPIGTGIPPVQSGRTQPPVLPMTETQWKQQAAQEAFSLLEQRMLRQGDRWFVACTVKPMEGPRALTPTPNSFAPLLGAGSNRTIPAGNYLVEIDTALPIVSTAGSQVWPDGHVDAWSGLVEILVQRHRVYREGQGWDGYVEEDMPIHWDWNAAVRDGKLSLSDSTEIITLNGEDPGIGDHGVTGFAARVIGLPNAELNRLTCTPASADDVTAKTRL
jgi:hypothetical protein